MSGTGDFNGFIPRGSGRRVLGNATREPKRPAFAVTTDLIWWPGSTLRP